MSPVDRALVESWIRRRDGDAFQTLVERYGGMVFASARRILGNVGDAEDLTQECFAVLAHLGEAPRTPLGPWLHRVVTNRALNRVKSDGARRARERRYAEVGPEAVEPSWDELERFLDEAIAELPERLRAPVVDHYLLGKSHHEIAEELGLSRQAVTYRVAKAVERLREGLRRRGVPIAGAALAAFLKGRTAEALPVGLSVALGKSALAAACGVVRPSVTAVPWLVKGAAVMTVTQKVAIGVGVAAVCLLLAGMTVKSAGFSAAEKPPIAVVEEAPAAAPAPTAVAAAASSPEQAKPLVRQPQAEPAQKPDALPPRPSLSGLWLVLSYTWSSDPTREPWAPFEREDAQVRMTAQGDDLSLEVLDPWDREAPYAKLSGKRKGYEVEFREGKSLPLVVKGRFSSGWTELVCEGGYSLAEASQAYLQERADNPEAYADAEVGHLHLALKRVEDAHAAAALKADAMLKERREAAKTLAGAMRAYAQAHEGKLPKDLKELIPEYLPEASLPADGKIRYEGGEVPASLLKEETAWEEFEPTMPVGERVTAWEEYQGRRWGQQSVAPQPVVTVEYGDPYLLFTIDGLGRVMERSYVGGPEAEDSAEVRAKVQDDLKELGVALVMFRGEHDDYLPGGWYSLAEGYLERPEILTHPLDPLGTISYELLLPAEPVSELGTGPGEIPMAAEARDRGTQPSGRNVLFADGHVQFFNSEEYLELCQRFGIEAP